jgi:hypothetical protein
MQDEQLERGAQALAAVIAGAVVAGRDARELTSQHGELAHQDVGDHPPLGLDQDLVEAALFAADLLPGLLQRAEPAIIDQDARYRIEPLVAGSAGDAGKARQPLTLGQDLFDDDVDSAAGCCPALLRHKRVHARP